MIKLIDDFNNIISDILEIGKNILPSEIENVVLPFLLILVLIIVYKTVRKMVI